MPPVSYFRKLLRRILVSAKRVRKSSRCVPFRLGFDSLPLLRVPPTLAETFKVRDPKSCPISRTSEPMRAHRRLLQPRPSSLRTDVPRWSRGLLLWFFGDITRQNRENVVWKQRSTFTRTKNAAVFPVSRNLDTGGSVLRSEVSLPYREFRWD